MWLIGTIIAKVTYVVIKIFRRGSGNTWPGHFALKLFPKIPGLIKYPKGIVLISGTNGKTTTSKLVAHLLESSGLKVTHNKTGANLLNGIVSTSLLDTDIIGSPKGDIGVFEVDELSLPVLLEHVSPSVLVLLNLSRDQLDRYGEVDTIFEKWKLRVSALSKDSVLILDGEQTEFKDLEKVFTGKTMYFNSDDTLQKKTNLLGDFNAKNVNASVVVLEALGFEEGLLEEYLAAFGAAYGRGEVIEKGDKKYSVFLAKNPASFNQNMDMISSSSVLVSCLFFILNDNIPDGRDVSWFYDIDPVKLRSACEGKKIYVSGTRYLDMVARLHYARVFVSQENAGPDILEVLQRIYIRDVAVFPNYSAMLEFRKILVGRKIL